MAKGFKTGGREQGTPNKLTKEFRETLSNILADEIDKIPETLQQLEPRDKLDIIVKLLPYIVPKMQSIRYKDETEQQQGHDLSHLTYEQLKELSGTEQQSGGTIRFVHGSEERINFSYLLKHLDPSCLSAKDFDLSNLSYDELKEIEKLTD